MVYLIIGLVFAAISLALSWRIMPPIITFIAVTFFALVGDPTLSYGWVDVPIMLLIAGFIPAVWEAGFCNSERKLTVTSGGTLAILSFVFGMILIPIGTTWSAWYAADYRALISVNDSVFSEDTAPVDIRQARRVDQKLAATVAKRAINEDPGLGSRVILGTMNIQQVRGELYWVGPLSHSGLGRWWRNSVGTPGYIIVSAVNENDVQFVRALGNKPIFLRYNMGAWFADNPKWYIYSTKGFWNVGRSDWTFEIDDAGRPYWVITEYIKRVGFSGSDATGVIVLDAQTGDVKRYNIAEAPAWIDRIQPEDFVTTQLNDWGYYIDGWLNSWWYKVGVTRTTDGMSLVYGADGQSYWYTGMRSTNANQGTVGFVLVNTRTKESRRYRQPGATENDAMASALGDYQEKGYFSTFPILYNVSGIPTYFVTLKDNAGLVKLVGWVSVENFSIVGVARTTRDAMRIYRRALVSNGNRMSAGGSSEQLEATGLVLRIGSESGGSGVTYYFLLEGYESVLFSGGSDLSSEISVTQVGDNVKVAYDPAQQGVADLAAFDNLSLSIGATTPSVKAVE